MHELGLIDYEAKVALYAQENPKRERRMLWQSPQGVPKMGLFENRSAAALMAVSTGSAEKCRLQAVLRRLPGHPGWWSRGGSNP